MKPADYLTNYKAVVNCDPDKVVTIDFETYFDSKEYSLKRMTMEAYVRDPRFKVHGMSVKKGRNPPLWIAGDKAVRQFFRTVPLNTTTMIAQNAPFDGLVMSHHYDARPAAWLDTQAIYAMLFGNTITSVSLDKLTQTFLPGYVKDQTDLMVLDGVRNPTAEQLEALGVYCDGDVEKEFLLFAKAHRALCESPLNADVIDLITTMFTDPVLELDRDVLTRLIADEMVEKQAAVDRSVANDMKQLNSSPKLATLLESLNVTVPMKISETTGKETYAFAKDDRDFVALLRHEDQRVRDLVGARLRCKTSINETRATSYSEVADRGTWPVHLHVSGARTTHRLSGASGGGGNPQNLGKKSPLRFAIKPPEGFRMFAIDSSNIELRVAMALAGEHAVCEQLRDEDFDLYSRFSTLIYNCMLHEIDSKRRGVGKVACLQLQYGSGAPTFRDMAWGWGIDLTEDEAQHITKLYRRTFTKVVKMWDTFDHILRKLLQGKAEETWFDHLIHAKVEGPMFQPALYMPETGLSITYPNLRREYDKKRGKWGIVYDGFNKKTFRRHPVNLYGAKAFQNSCQALARNVVLHQTLALDRFLKEEIHHTCRTTMSVHDEAVCLVPEHADCDAALDGALDIFKTSPAWWPELPTFGEGAWGDNYGEAKP